MRESRQGVGTAEEGVPHFKRVRISAALAVSVLMVIALAGGFNSSSSRAGVFSGKTVSGTISLTASKGQCASTFICFDCQNETLDHVTLNVNVDMGGSRNAINFGAGCTGTVTLGTVITIAQDAVRVGGAHDLTVSGGEIRCNTTTNQGHQDGIQVTSGTNVTFSGIFVNCRSATNGQFYVNSIGRGIPDNIIFEGGTLAPDPSHVNNVVINNSTNSGVMDSTVCPDARPDPIQIGHQAVGGVNRNNTFPASCALIVNPPACKVPKVKGKKLVAAKAAIRKAHCAVGRVRKAFSAKTKKGKVISQKPAPSAARRAGFPVKLTVSKGRRRTSH